MVWFCIKNALSSWRKNYVLIVLWSENFNLRLRLTAITTKKIEFGKLWTYFGKYPVVGAHVVTSSKMNNYFCLICHVMIFMSASMLIAILIARSVNGIVIIPLAQQEEENTRKMNLHMTMDDWLSRISELFQSAAIVKWWNLLPNKCSPESSEILYTKIT